LYIADLNLSVLEWEYYNSIDESANILCSGKVKIYRYYATTLVIIFCSCIQSTYVISKAKK